MITPVEEYLAKRYLIDSSNPLRVALCIPSDEKIYNIDLNNRTVEAPEFLSASTDHNAEFIYFCMDRYYDNMDMANTVGLVQYKNKNAVLDTGEPDLGHVYFIPYYDITKEKDKIIFPWLIGGKVTAAAGPVEFAMRFYKIDDNGKQYSFNLNTLPAFSKVLEAMNVITPENENFIIPGSEIEQLRQQIQALEQDWDLYWEDLYD